MCCAHLTVIEYQTPLLQFSNMTCSWVHYSLCCLSLSYWCMLTDGCCHHLQLGLLHAVCWLSVGKSGWSTSQAMSLYIASNQYLSVCLVFSLHIFSLIVRVWLSDSEQEFVDRGLTLGWMQIIAVVAHTVVHWIRQTSPPRNVGQPCIDIGYKTLV